MKRRKDPHDGPHGPTPTGRRIALDSDNVRDPRLEWGEEWREVERRDRRTAKRTKRVELVPVARPRRDAGATGLEVRLAPDGMHARRIERPDLLRRLHARGAIDAAQLHAARHLQRLDYLAEVKGPTGTLGNADRVDAPQRPDDVSATAVDAMRWHDALLDAVGASCGALGRLVVVEVTRSPAVHEAPCGAIRVTTLAHVAGRLRLHPMAMSDLLRIALDAVARDLARTRPRRTDGDGD